jgi:hypothetical protein
MPVRRRICMFSEASQPQAPLHHHMMQGEGEGLAGRGTSTAQRVPPMTSLLHRIGHYCEEVLTGLIVTGQPTGKVYLCMAVSSFPPITPDPRPGIYHASAAHHPPRICDCSSAARGWALRSLPRTCSSRPIPSIKATTTSPSRYWSPRPFTDALDGISEGVWLCVGTRERTA